MFVFSRLDMGAMMAITAVVFIVAGLGLLRLSSLSRHRRMELHRQSQRELRTRGA